MTIAVTVRTAETETTRRWTTPGGQVVGLRAVAPADIAPMSAFLRRLSFGTRYFRFGCGEIRFSDEELARLCNSDPALGRHFVVVTEENGAETLIASGRFFVLAAGECGEMEILVTDAWQGTRVAHRLMSALIDSARAHGLKRLCAQVLPSNSRMLKFARRHGFTLQSGTDGHAIKILCLLLDASTRPQGAGQGCSAAALPAE